MSTPESIVVSLDWAKKLKGTGWPPSCGLYYWMQYDNLPWGLQEAGYEMQSIERTYGDDVESCVAPTAEELLRRLPRYLRKDAKDYFLGCAYGVQTGKGIVGYQANDGRFYDFGLETFMEDTLANAAAAMYCHLAVNNLLKT